MPLELTQIGTVRSDFEQPADPERMRSRESRIVLEPSLEAGLTGIERNDHLVVLFYLHESDGYDLVAPRRDGIERGTFACRSPYRPSPVGSTTVELLERDGRQLRVAGLDAIDGTPVIDIKPYAASLDCPSRPESDDHLEDE